MNIYGMDCLQLLINTIQPNQSKFNSIQYNTKVSFTIKANFDVMRFGGTKSLVISTTSFFGGKNPFLGWSYIVVGGVCILLGAAFGAKHMMNPRRLGDTRYLVWKEA